MARGDFLEIIAFEKLAKRIRYSLNQASLLQLSLVNTRLYSFAAPTAYRSLTLDKRSHFDTLLNLLDDLLAIDGPDTILKTDDNLAHLARVMATLGSTKKLVFQFAADRGEVDLALEQVLRSEELQPTLQELFDEYAHGSTSFESDVGSEEDVLSNFSGGEGDDRNNYEDFDLDNTSESEVLSSEGNLSLSSYEGFDVDNTSGSEVPSADGNLSTSSLESDRQGSGLSSPSQERLAATVRTANDSDPVSRASNASVSSSRQESLGDDPEEEETTDLIYQFRQIVHQLMTLNARSACSRRHSTVQDEPELHSTRPRVGLKRLHGILSLDVPFSNVDYLDLKPFDHCATGMDSAMPQNTGVRFPSAFPCVTHLMLGLSSSVDQEQTWNANLLEMVTIVPNVQVLNLHFLPWSAIDPRNYTHLASLAMVHMRQFPHLYTVQLYMDSVHTKMAYPLRHGPDSILQHGQDWGVFAVDVAVRMMVDAAAQCKDGCLNFEKACTRLQGLQNVNIHLPAEDIVVWTDRIPGILDLIYRDQRRLYGRELVRVKVMCKRVKDTNNARMADLFSW